MDQLSLPRFLWREAIVESQAPSLSVTMGLHPRSCDPIFSSCRVRSEAGFADKVETAWSPIAGKVNRLGSRGIASSVNLDRHHQNRRLDGCRIFASIGQRGNRGGPRISLIAVSGCRGVGAARGSRVLYQRYRARVMCAALRGAIRVYQLFLSPLLLPSCRYVPSCSEYAAEAIGRHGALQGSVLALRRLARCHPWGGSGYDPVPPLAASDPLRTGADR